jgi:hypothetical protein
MSLSSLVLEAAEKTLDESRRLMRWATSILLALLGKLGESPQGLAETLRLMEPLSPREIREALREYHRNRCPESASIRLSTSPREPTLRLPGGEAQRERGEAP